MRSSVYEVSCEGLTARDLAVESANHEIVEYLDRDSSAFPISAALSEINGFKEICESLAERPSTL